MPVDCIIGPQYDRGAKDLYRKRQGGNQCEGTGVLMAVLAIGAVACDDNGDGDGVRLHGQSQESGYRSHMACKRSATFSA